MLLPGLVALSHVLVPFYGDMNLAVHVREFVPPQGPVLALLVRAVERSPVEPREKWAPRASHDHAPAETALHHDRVMLIVTTADLIVFQFYHVKLAGFEPAISAPPAQRVSQTTP